jgi:hypothetical protein
MVLLERAKPLLLRSREIDSGNWVQLRECGQCGQLWIVDEPDMRESGFAIKAPDRTSWKSFDTTVVRKEYLAKSRGGPSSSSCIWANCGKPALCGVVLCVDHLYETGARA